MVKIAVAGGSGQVAQEVIDALVAARKHEITILSRKASADIHTPGATSRVVNYANTSELVEALQGIHTVLSFIQLLSDPGNISQKNLIDAAITAGVKRFAPSEWGRQVKTLMIKVQAASNNCHSAEVKDMPWWTGKEQIREYLKEVNKDGKVLEYSLFQPGLFLDYLAFPHQTAKHVSPLNTMFDFQNRRAIVVDGHDFIMTVTTAQDLASVVARTVEYEGIWPVVGGIQGNRVKVSQILAIGEKVRGFPFAIDTVKLEDLEAGVLKTSWTLETRHSSVPEDQAADLLKTVLIGTLLSGANGAWDVSDEINQTLPDHKFSHIEDFLAKVWEGKP